jgi:acetyltransferase-like isoleucine patch superfamily enzyme
VAGVDVTVYAGTELAADAVVGDGAVLGKPPRLAAHSRAAGDAPPPPLRVAVGCSVAAGAVVFAGAVLERGARVEEGAFVRERARVGEGSVVGPRAAVDNGVALGAGVLVGAGSYVTAGSVVEDGVSIGPNVVTTNDDTMGRHDGARPLVGAILRRGCRVGAGSVLVPGVEVGADAVVAPGSVVTRDVAPGETVGGVPAVARPPSGEPGEPSP